MFQDRNPLKTAGSVLCVLEPVTLCSLSPAQNYTEAQLVSQTIYRIEGTTDNIEIRTTKTKT
uniref:Uncharacterized protein n=1 Tax=Anguilla anguilla TaxID=7936 RepID=A0A0E9VLY6_ANGAN